MFDHIFEGMRLSQLSKHIYNSLELVRSALGLNGCGNPVVRADLIFFLLACSQRQNQYKRRKNKVLDDYNCALCASQVEETLLHLFFWVCFQSTMQGMVKNSVEYSSYS